ncbi:MAG: AAA family ATPase [Bacilli bacterium]|nr:AAA family ATPase [Bacilli bacterium]
MYLKSIRLEGFKSFADKTLFELNKGITAIVGPNGSGKSNIVDAVRWVLGEQSVKSLRGGSQMSDVIFSGSEYKDALNKASVTLTFDNSDKYLNSEFSEIEVKRSVYKSGESEYFINNTRVRLKDIQDLFIDSGSGNDAFNIISQGTVTDIVNSKPMERRVIFESAAGVLKYKKRKEESLRKLDKTKDNLNSVNLVISELETTIGPLKEQAEVAKKYVDIKEELKSNEIALTTRDITDINREYKELKQKEEELTEKLDGMVKVSNNTEIEKIKLDIYKLDDEISVNNKKMLNLTEEISMLSSEKRITIERTKYEYSDDKLKSNLINLKEEELNLIKEIEVSNNEIDVLNNNIKNKKDITNNSDVELKNILSKRTIYTNDLNSLIKEKFSIENRIDILEANILNNEKLPSSVKNILNNPRLKGIHNTIGNLIDIPDNYLLCTDVVLSASSNFLVVDNEISAKEAINYLKDNKLGRATFLPLNIIKPRYVEDSIKERIVQINGYVGILSELINYDSKYSNVIENQLGNVIVAKDIDSMNLIAKILEYKFRVVSLDGSIVYAGGSISGGGVHKHNLSNTKQELENNKIRLDEIKIKIDKLNNEIKEINNEYEIVNNTLLKHSSELINLNTIKDTKIKTLDELEEKLKIVKNDIEGITNIKENSLDKKLEDIMNKLNVLTIEKEKLETSINELKLNKDELSNKLSLLELEVSKSNSEYKMVSNELNSVSVNVGKLNVKLDNLLLYLNEEYNMTYEYAKENYDLDIEIDLVRNKVHKLKHEIKSLGEVNIGSIKEYERLNTRYEFLTNQKNDLELSMNNLYEIINDMDNIMTEKFKTTFDKVSEEFSKVFKIMFQGGIGKLELTDPNDFLNTGVDMIIVPPGKKIHNTQSLSGGEKSLTAICLLFAILNVSPVPFIILDEVEAALDEVNVDLFGEFLNKKKMDSQYILITHKKRMMEYADVLYGITMQNAGISKVVGVKLEDN